MHFFKKTKFTTLPYEKPNNDDAPVNEVEFKKYIDIWTPVMNSYKTEPLKRL